MTALRYLVASMLLFSMTEAAQADWPQWGGPQRNFKLTGVKLAGTWPKEGPVRLWRRALGDGYSSILSSNGQLYTMHRAAQREHIIALDAGSGQTIWEHSYPAPFLDGTNVKEFGPGPLSTPLLEQGRLFAVGVTGVLHCLDVRTGSVVWQRNLMGELKGTNLFRGYSASPVAYEDLVIIPVGGEGRGVVAFRQLDGSIAWQKHDFAISHASPILIDRNGGRQLVVLGHKILVGVAPRTGERLWRHPHPIDGGYVSSSPVWCEDGRVVFSAAYGEGTRCVLLKEGSSEPEEIWHNQQMRVHHSNVIRLGETAYGSSGDFSALFFAAFDTRSGKLLWRNRGVGRANSIYADGKFIILREEGTLLLASLSPQGMTELAGVKLFEGRAWTAPTLDNNRLYLRNRHEIMALQLPTAD